MGLERELARSPTGESPNVDNGPPFRRQDSSAHVGDEGLRASAEHTTGHSSGPGADDSNDGVSTSTRPSLPLRARTWAESGTGEQSDGDDDDSDSGSDDGLVMAVRRRPQPPQRAATEPASSAIQRFVPVGRQGRPAPLALKHTPYLPKDGPRSPPTTWRNPALAHGAIASPVDEESRVCCTLQAQPMCFFAYSRAFGRVVVVTASCASSSGRLSPLLADLGDALYRTPPFLQRTSRARAGSGADRTPCWGSRHARGAECAPSSFTKGLSKRRGGLSFPCSPWLVFVKQSRRSSCHHSS